MSLTKIHNRMITGSFVNVLDFGATGDGSTDDTSAIQAAISSATTNKQTLIFPAGTYKHTSTLEFTCNVEGIGDNESTPRLMSVGDILSVRIRKFYGFFRGMVIWPDGTGSTNNIGLKLSGIARTHVENVYVRNCGHDGIVIDSTQDTLGVDNKESSNLGMLSNVQSISNGRHGIYIAGGINQNGMVFNNIDVRGNVDGFHAGAYFAGCFLHGLTAQNNSNYGVYFNAATCRNNVGTIYVEANTNGDLIFSADAHSNFITLSNNGTGFTDNNGTNTVIQSGSGSTQRYVANRLDFLTARITDASYTGQLGFAQTANNEYKIEHQGAAGAGNLTFSKGSASNFNVKFEGTVQPVLTATNNLGTGSVDWNNIYLVNSPIISSDENLKRDVRAIEHQEKLVALEIKSKLKAFRYNSAYEAKGDAARLHIGVIAQDVKLAFENAGLDPERYSLFCKDIWYEDNEGNIFDEMADGLTEKSRLAIRYEQLLAFILSAI